MADLAKIGAWAFTIGVIVALLAGFMPASPWLKAVLVVLGLIVGFLNVTGKETTPFLMAAVAIMIAVYTAGASIESDMAALGSVGTYLLAIMKNINTLVFPATIVVALKAVFALAKE